MNVAEGATLFQQLQQQKKAAFWPHTTGRSVKNDFYSTSLNHLMLYHVTDKDLSFLHTSSLSKRHTKWSHIFTSRLYQTVKKHEKQRKSYGTDIFKGHSRASLGPIFANLSIFWNYLSPSKVHFS